MQNPTRNQCVKHTLLVAVTQYKSPVLKTFSPAEAKKLKKYLLPILCPSWSKSTQHCHWPELSTTKHGNGYIIIGRYYRTMFALEVCASRDAFGTIIINLMTRHLWFICIVHCQDNHTSIILEMATNPLKLEWHKTYRMKWNRDLHVCVCVCVRTHVCLYACMRSRVHGSSPTSVCYFLLHEISIASRT